MNRREFLQTISYMISAVALSYAAHRAHYREFPKSSFELEPGVELEIKPGGALLRIENINKRELSDMILNSKIRVDGKRYVFERYLEKSDTREIFIALFHNSNTSIYFKPYGENHYEHINTFDQRFRLDRFKLNNKEHEFYYIGDRDRARSLFREYFSAIKDMYNVDILIAAPKIVEGRRNHSDVYHIWSDVDLSKRAILYKDNNEDPIIIKDRVKKLAKLLENLSQ